MSTRIERLAQMAELIEQRRKGVSIANIAAASGLSPSTVQRRLRDAYAAMGAETADEMRRGTEDRVDDVLARAYALLETLDASEHPKVLRLILQAERTRMVLNGYAVPQRVVLELEGLGGNN